MKKISSIILCAVLTCLCLTGVVNAKAPTASKTQLVSVDELLRKQGLTSEKSKLRALAVNQVGNKVAFYFEVFKTPEYEYGDTYEYKVVEDGITILTGKSYRSQPGIFKYTQNGHLITVADPDYLYYDGVKVDTAPDYSGFLDEESIIFFQGTITYPLDQFVKRYNPDLKKTEVIFTATGHVEDVRIDREGNVFYIAAEDGRLPVQAAYYLFKNGIKISTHPIDPGSLMINKNGDFYFTDNGAVYKNNVKIATGPYLGCLVEDAQGALWYSTAEGPPNYASHVYSGTVEKSKQLFSMPSMNCQSVVGKDFSAIALKVPEEKNPKLYVYKNGSFIGNEGFTTAFDGMSEPTSELIFDSRGTSYLQGYINNKPQLFVDGKKYISLFGKKIGSVWALVPYKGKMRIYYTK